MADRSSRRAVLGGLAALPALTAPAIAEPNPDATLIALCAAHAEVDAAYAKALAAYQAIANSPEGVRPGPPDALKRKGDFEFFYGNAVSRESPVFYDWSDAKFFREYEPPPTMFSERARRAASARAAQITEAFDAWGRALDAHATSSGLDAAYLAADDLDDQRNALCARIKAIRPTTLAGLIAKARVADAWDAPVFDTVLRADLVAMGGQA